MAWHVRHTSSSRAIRVHDVLVRVALARSMDVVLFIRCGKFALESGKPHRQRLERSGFNLVFVDAHEIARKQAFFCLVVELRQDGIICVYRVSLLVFCARLDGEFTPDAIMSLRASLGANIRDCERWNRKYGLRALQ